MTMLKLAIISTHPIQYYAPLFQRLARSKNLQLRVFYTWSQTADASVPDAGFGRQITWDIPLLEGYQYQFIPNIARRPGTDHFWGLRNPQLNDAIVTWQADAILVFGWNCASHLQVLRHFKGRIPVFFRGDSTLLDPRSPFRSAARRVFLRWVYSHIDVAIAVGSNNRDYYHWCGIPDERIALAPHAVDVVRFSDPQGTHEERAVQWRTELSISPTSRAILFAGKLQVKKDPLLLLDAYLASGVPGDLIFVGDGELMREIRARAQGRRDVHFLPFQNQQAMPAVYRLGEVFVLPSRGPGETWGLALNEAMACQRPVIASDKVGGARDLVTQGLTGWQFEAGNLQQLKEAVRAALTCQPHVLRNMGTAARREIAHWSIEAAVEGIERTVMRYVSGTAVTTL
jgi:glycosyltransferase involved in cell wall biosynthesis